MSRPLGEIRGRVGGGAKKPVDMVTSMDGRSYPSELSQKIDRVVFLALSSGPGKDLLEFLEGITLRTVLPVTATPEELQAIEAQRRLVAMLKQRLNRAQVKA